MRRMNVKTTEELYSAVDGLSSSDEPVEIVLAKNTVFELDKTLKITRSNVKLIGNHSVLSGSKSILLEGKEEIVKIHLSDYGIDKMTGLSAGPFRDFWHDYAIPKPYMEQYGMGTRLFWKNKKLPLARYPKRGFVNAEKFLEDQAVFFPEDKRILSWTQYEDVILTGYWKWEWANQRCFIQSIDAAGGTVSLSEPRHCYGYKDGAHYFALNVEEELSARGEWSKNVRDNSITLYRKKGQDEVRVTLLFHVIEITNVENVALEGITVQECEGTGIRISDSRNVTVKQCAVKNTGAWGIIADECSDTVISDCAVSKTDGGGIAVSGGDRKTLTPSGNQIVRCHISEVAQWHRTYMAAAQVSGVGGAVSGCLIENVPHFAIVYHGNNHLIEKNEIAFACYEANDAGAIYSGADWTCRGIVIRENHFHDINGLNGKGCYGIYFDDYVSSAEVYKNIFVNVHQGILIGGGRDYDIHDNLFYNGVSAVVVDDRTNVVSDTWIERLKKKAQAVEYRSGIWQRAYPNLYHILEQNYRCEESNSIKNNITSNMRTKEHFVYLKNGVRLPAETEKCFVKNLNRRKG